MQPHLQGLNMIPEMGECELWDCVSSDDHNAVFDIFTEESKLVGERCRSGSATLKEKSTLTRFLVELGALRITVYEAEKEGNSQRSVKVSIPERRAKESQPDGSGSIVKQATGMEMTSELSAVADEHKDSDAGDSSDCGDIMDGNDDDDDEIPVWMRDPPVVEQIEESVNTPKEVDPKDKLTCSKCPAIFHNPWDLDLHNLEDHREPQPKLHQKQKPKRQGIPYSSKTCHCDFCNTVIKRKDMLFHLFKEHDLSYEEAVKKIPRFSVGLSKRLYLRFRGVKSDQSDICISKCDICSNMKSDRSMLMHLYKYHGFSYQDAVKKVGVKDRANKSKPDAPKELGKGYQLRNAKRVSPARKEITEERARGKKEAKKKKRQPKQQRKEQKSRRRKSQPKEMIKDGEPVMKIAFIKLKKMDEEVLERYEIHAIEHDTECNDLREIDSQQTTLPTSATTDVKHDLDRSEIPSEQNKDVRVGPEEANGHECEQTSELGEGDAFTPDEQSGDIDSQQTALPTSATAGLKQNLDRSEIPREQDKDIGVGPKEDGHECDPNSKLYSEGVASTSHEQSGVLIAAVVTDSTNVDQNEECQVPVNTSETDLDNKRPADMENEERSDIIDSDQVRDDVSLLEDVREVGNISVAENDSSGSEKDSSLHNNTHLGEEENLDDREQTSNPIEGGQLCNICGKGFNSESQVRDHLVTVHFQCTTCFKTYKSAATLKVHVQYHINEAAGVRYTCPFCPRSFFNKSVHATHVKTHTNKEECHICHLKCVDPRTLKLHINRMHTQKDKYPCDQCDRVFFRANDLTTHVSRKHSKTKKWKCDECGKGFYTKSDVTIHKKNVHVAPGQHLCELCGNAFKTKGNLAQHHLNVHTDSLKFNCDICGKNFKRSSALSAHRMIHSDSRPLKCEVCGKGFRHRHKLNVHLDWHNDVRKFACKLCPKTFLTKGNLVKHQTVHTKMYKHSCDSCGHGFSDLPQLRLHLSRVHGIILKSKITKGNQEKNVQSKAKSPTIASAENQTNSGISAEIEPSTTNSTTENQSRSITGRIDMDEHVIDSETQVHNPAVLNVTSEASCGDDNLLATEVFTAMMHSHGIQ